jgi:pimeloyl-ACP methyl ester carboxylesterase
VVLLKGLLAGVPPHRSGRQLNRQPAPGAQTAALGAAALGGAWLTAHSRSPLVRAWAPGAGERRRVGRLSVRTNGEGDDGLVLLHGITASGDIFGRPYDDLAKGRRLVIPDLIGFGGSMDLESTKFALEAHLDALDEMVDALAVTPTVVLGHSLGALVGLHWGARRGDVKRLIWCVRRSTRRPRKRTPGSALWERSSGSSPAAR